LTRAACRKIMCLSIRITSYGVSLMDETTVSSKYQVVIPKSVREKIPLRPGQKLAVIVKGGVISLVPVPTLKELRGLAQGAAREPDREEEDRV